MSIVNEFVESVLPNDYESMQVRFLPLWLLNPVAALEPLLLLAAPLAIGVKYLPEVVMFFPENQGLVKAKQPAVSEIKDEGPSQRIEKQSKQSKQFEKDNHPKP